MPDSITLPTFSAPKSGQALQLLWAECASPPTTARLSFLRHDAFPPRGRFLPCSCFLCFSFYPVQFLLHSHRRCYVIVRRLRLGQFPVRTTKGLDYPTWRCKRDSFSSTTGCGETSSSVKPSRATLLAGTFSSPWFFASSLDMLFKRIPRGEMCRALPLPWLSTLLS